MNIKRPLTNTWHRIPRPIRMSLVLMVGSSIIVAGLAMLVLPGPGWAAIFLGFAVLATEFAFAERVRNWLVTFLRNLIVYIVLRWKLIRSKKK